MANGMPGGDEETRGQSAKRDLTRGGHRLEDTLNGDRALRGGDLITTTKLITSTQRTVSQKDLRAASEAGATGREMRGKKNDVEGRTQRSSNCPWRRERG